MAECPREFEVGGAVNETNIPVNELGYEQLTNGVVFKSDIEGDFFLTDPLDEVVDEDGVGVIDENELSWNANDPNKPGPTIDYLKERPKPIEILQCEMMNLTEDAGIKKRILEYGSGGTYPPPKSKLYYHYAAWVDDNPDTFDTSLGRNAESLIVGADADVLRGLRIAVESMKLHEVAQFLLSHEYAYGKMGCPPRIGKEAMVIFTIKTIHFVTEDRLKNIQYMTNAQRSELSFATIVDGCTSIRALGNGYYNSAKYPMACREYRLSIEILDGYWGVKTKEEEDIRFDFLCGAYCNLAQCYLKLEKGPQACNACKNALRYQVNHYLFRIYFLFGRAHGLLGRFEKGIQLLDKSIEHGGPVRDCEKYKAEFIASKQRGNKNYADMCKSMFKMKELDITEKVRGKETVSLEDRAGTSGTAWHANGPKQQRSQAKPAAVPSGAGDTPVANTPVAVASYYEYAYEDEGEDVSTRY